MILFSILSLMPVTPIFAGAGVAAAVVFSSRKQILRRTSTVPPMEIPAAVVASETVNTTKNYLLEDVKVLFEQKQIYLRQGLRIDDIARECMTNRTYVSNCINEYYGQSFTSIVNSFRVEYAKELIKQYGNTRKLSSICEEAGFTDEVSFIRNFKKFTGKTPSEWGSRMVS